LLLKGKTLGIKTIAGGKIKFRDQNNFREGRKKGGILRKKSFE
jgi:hypothetical protein